MSIIQSPSHSSDFQTTSPQPQTIPLHKANEIQSLLISALNNPATCKCQCHQKQSNTEIQSIKLKLYLQQSQHNFNMQMLRNQLDEIKHENQCLINQNTKLKELIISKEEQRRLNEKKTEEYQNKIMNQQRLIDEYKVSFMEQIKLEKQIIKAGYLEKQYQLKHQLQKALRNMENNYKKKEKQWEKNSLNKQYNHNLREIKRYCGHLADTHQSIKLNKQNIKLGGTETKKLQGCSSYSTIDK